MNELLPNIKEDNSTRASLELLYNISRELSSALDLRTLLERVLFLSMQNVGAINGSIIVLDDNGVPVDSAIIAGDTVHKHTTKRLLEPLDQRSVWLGGARTAGGTGGKYQPGFALDAAAI